MEIKQTQIVIQKHHTGSRGSFASLRRLKRTKPRPQTLGFVAVGNPGILDFKEMCRLAKSLQS